MADNTYTNGAATGVTTTAGNWSAGSAPANNESLFFRGAYASDLDAALSGLSAITANSITVASDYRNNIGTSAGTQFQISATQLNMYGRGEWNFFDGTFTRVNANCGYSADAFNIDGTITFLDVQGGNVTANGTSAITTAAVTGEKARFVIPVGAAVTTLHVCSGMVKKNAAVTTIYQSGGIVESLLGNITTLVLSGGPSTRFSLAAGTITSVIMNGGYLDLRNSGQRRTITTLWANNGTIDASDVGDSLTLTNGYRVSSGNVKIIDPTGSLTRAIS